jgi:galactokinase
MPEPVGPELVVRAPGRVNLMGDHTDYVGGLALPMAIDLATTVAGHRVRDRVRLSSEGFEGIVELVRDEHGRWPTTVASTLPAWGRYVAAVVAELEPATGFEGVITTTLPVGAGLSSSAALEVAVALACLDDQARAQLGPLDLAQACQRAEHRASGVPCGLMDQLISVNARAGSALLVDFASLDTEPVPLPEAATVVVVHSGQARRLEDSPYAARIGEVEATQRQIGPLRHATLADVATVSDPAARARGRHVVTENARVRAFARALGDHDLVAAGAIMAESHASNRDDFEASTPVVDQLVERLSATPGVYGARLVGGGFGGCVVALTEPGALEEGWTVRPSAGATVTSV